MQTGQRVAAGGMLVSGALALLKIMVGMSGHSAAVVADGLESTGDVFASAFVLLGLTLAAIVFRSCRRVVLVAAVVDGVVDWASRRQTADDDAQPIGLLTYLLLKRIDDLAYGLGLWYGVLRERNFGPLKPQIRV